MKSIGPNRRFGMLMLFTLLFAVGSIGCSDTGGDGNPGGGGSPGTRGAPGTENPCLQDNDPACSTATLDNGFGEVRILFDEQRVEAAPDSSIPAFAAKGGRASTLFLVSAYEGTADCMTNQPGDLFRDVACVPYWNDTFIQAEVGKWFRLVFTEDASNSSAPVTIRLSNIGGDAYTLEAAWGAFACD